MLWAAGACAEDWPQWRGPGSQGVSAETGLPVEWGAGKNIAWKAELAGTGASSPIVTGELVVVTSQVGTYTSADGSDPRLARDDRALAVRENAIGSVKSADGKLYLVVEALRKTDGKKVWEFRMEAVGDRPDNHEKHNLATPTPVTDGKRIYAWFGNGQLVALDRAGREVWKRHLGEKQGSFMNQWGHGSSPALYKGTLILLCDHRPVSYLVALDPETGKEKWRVGRGAVGVSEWSHRGVGGPRVEEPE